MPIYTIQQGYNALHLRQVTVRAKNVAAAVRIANESDEGDESRKVLDCGGWRDCMESGPTFTLSVAEGDHDNAFDAPAGDQREVPELDRQFHTEWAAQARALRELTEVVLAFTEPRGTNTDDNDAALIARGRAAVEAARASGAIA